MRKMLKALLPQKVRDYLATDIEVLIEAPEEYTLVEDNSLAGGALTQTTGVVGAKNRSRVIFHDGEGSYIIRRDLRGSTMEIRRVSADSLRITVIPPPSSGSRACVVSECRLSSLGNMVTVPDSRGQSLLVRRIRHRDFRLFAA